eukprot:TRINITY_DN91255_c0_g1_i1.p1 TRINITY_DN91255_c0_g1~~TRINITY_DN91255_c0_g1_i1.p1  ORF type:complete len:429 (+),score=130.40 TRINITY_DN91255_c0_g1_i1:152-1438(+)
MQQDGRWTCQYKGCQSSAEQVAAIRERKPAGYPHDEDESLRVCTVCRRLPLSAHLGIADEEPLDGAFLSGIKEELSAIEENETNVQALSQVFRYYAKHAKQLAQVLFDFVTKQCFPWELIHALHLVDDILLMDNTGRYKAELTDRVLQMSVSVFKKVKKESEKREVAKMMFAWAELKIFDLDVIEGIREAIRKTGEAAAKILHEAALGLDDDEPAASPPPASPDAEVDPAGKRRKVEEAKSQTAAANGGAGQAAKAPVAPAELQRRSMAALERLDRVPIDRPFELLGVTEAEVDADGGAVIRSAYRRIALLIHPDKNPGLEAQCADALVKLQMAREQAENEMQRKAAKKKEPEVFRGDTRAAATSAAANAAMDSTQKCKYPGCELPPCKQCANGCCTRNITHCHALARGKGGLQCFFHPPPRAWARNA